MITTTPQGLLEYLTQKNYQAKIEEDTKQILVVLEVSGREFPLFFRSYEESDLLQLLVFLPTQIKSGAHNDLARLMHLMNKELDVPGFGMDENSNTIFYRVMLPTIDQTLDERVIESMMKCIHVVCDEIAPTLIAVANQIATYQEVLERAKHGR